MFQGLSVGFIFCVLPFNCSKMIIHNQFDGGKCGGTFSASPHMCNKPPVYWAQHPGPQSRLWRDRHKAPVWTHRKSDPVYGTASFPCLPVLPLIDRRDIGSHRIVGIGLHVLRAWVAVAAPVHRLTTILPAPVHGGVPAVAVTAVLAAPGVHEL